MSPRRSSTVGLVLVAASAIASILAYPELPARMATHWNGAGEPDGYMAKNVALALFPALSLGMLALLTNLPRLDPLRENVAQFREQYDQFVVLLVAFLVYVHLLVLAWNVGYRFEMLQGLAPALGALFYFVGTLLEHAEQNWFIGIRTPWTLTNEEVWNHTHERAAPLFKLAGVLAVLGVFVPSYAFLLVIGPVVAISLYTTVYSYVEYRRVTA
ncbi:SdpI family protein [Halorussus halophilus]|uniref:SdpI family protein n=1 Tax=Halorussus halophilus TaxID=2650975 RepID=UPI001300DAE9|nr:SdpI family protein [Halorussus halophilus]